MNNAPETLVYSVLTPQGQGAVATMSVRGTLADAVLAAHFRGSGPRQVDWPLVGHWYRDAQPPGEEVVVRILSPTHFEVHCHGGTAAVEAIAGDLAARGGHRQSWSEALAATEDDPHAAGLWAQVPLAPTERAAAVLLTQAQGAFARRLDQIERWIESSQPAPAQAALQRLLDLAPLGQHLVEPFRVVIAGRPNVGKSSLLNALVGFERAVVFDQPGTTRDAVSSLAAFEGWPVELTDTAGLRATPDRLESAGIAASQRHLATADVVLLVLDGSAALESHDQALLRQLPEALVIVNKCDRPAAWSWDAAGDGRRAHLASATQRTGLAEVMAAVMARLVPAAPISGEAVPVGAGDVARCQELLAKCQAER